MKYLKMLVLGAVMIVPVAINAQDRDHRSYEDKAHHDTHEWNDRETEAYRRYLQEHHRKYHDFEKAKKSEQSDYWKWRHSHPDDHR